MTGNGTAQDGARGTLVDFMQRFVGSAQFRQVFEEGMRLVEETADYLDGPGREAVRTLSRDDAMLYATESMRLTTRLMQLASWLLLQRAVGTGELSEQDATREQESIDLAAMADPLNEETLRRLPVELGGLLRRTHDLHERILRLDEAIRRRSAPVENTEHPLRGMLNRLHDEFARGRNSSNNSED